MVHLQAIPIRAPRYGYWSIWGGAESNYSMNCISKTAFVCVIFHLAEPQTTSPDFSNHSEVHVDAGEYSPVFINLMVIMHGQI